MKEFTLLSAHFYLGSANIGSRGATWTKEIGIIGSDCLMLASDAKKIFSLYWSIDGLKKLPDVYPKQLATKINLEKPLKVLNRADNTIYKVII